MQSKDVQSFQSDRAISNVTRIRADRRSVGNAYLIALMINSVAISPRLTAWLVDSVPPFAATASSCSKY